MISQKTLSVRTRGRGTIEVTAEVARVVKASAIQTGVCTIFLQHTSASLILCENADTAVRRDLEALFARLAPDGDHAGYVAAVRKAVANVVAQGFLLQQDANALIAAAEASRVLRP